MEVDLKYFVNGRRPQIILLERKSPILLLMKYDFKHISLMEDDLKLKMEDVH